MPATRYALPESTQMILGGFDDHGLADPQRWVAKQLRAGRFRGQKIGRQWFMRAEDIAAAEDALMNPSAADKAPAPAEPSIDEPGIIRGLSARAKRSRLITGPQL